MLDLRTPSRSLLDCPLNLKFEYTVRLGSRCRSVFKTREFRLDYLTNMVDGIEKMSFVCWHFLASRILAEISSVKNTNKNAL